MRKKLRRGNNLLENGYDMRIVQGLLGRTNVEMTLVYTRVLNRVRGGTNGRIEWYRLDVESASLQQREA
jgi:hypothetical protein